MSNLILSHVSPISPRGVMSISAFEGKNQDKTLVPPLPTSKKSSKEKVLPNETTQVAKQQQAKFYGSVAYHGRYIIRPSDKIMAPMMHTVLSDAPNAATAVARISRAVLDDILVNQRGFQRSGEDIYIGYIQGHRVGLARLDDHNTDSYALACSDQDTASHFLLLLRSSDSVDVVDDSGMYD